MICLNTSYTSPGSPNSIQVVLHIACGTAGLEFLDQGHIIFKAKQEAVLRQKRKRIRMLVHPSKVKKNVPAAGCMA